MTCLCQVINQGVWYYSTEFFTEVGLPHPLAGTLISAVIFMVATLAAVPLIEKALQKYYGKTRGQRPRCANLEAHQIWCFE